MRDFLAMLVRAGWSDEVATPTGPRTNQLQISGGYVSRHRGDWPLCAILSAPFLPFGKGRIANGVIECGYHGLQFGPSRRRRRQSAGPISKALAVESFTMAERTVALWWLGDSAKAAWSHPTCRRSSKSIEQSFSWPL